MNRHWILVWFNEKSIRLDCVNKRAEMHINVLDWLKAGGSIDPNDDDLYEEFIAIELVGTMDGKYKLPPKEDIKEIIGRSPNRLDCLAISFAFPVKRKPRPDSIQDQLELHRNKNKDYDPLDRE